jgi:EmrB/QacA subfamily drug resistance transporter
MLSSFSHKQIIALVISFAMFMEAVDTTIINTAIPVMSKALQVNPIDMKIALISYLLSLSIFIPISGWLADKFGIKRIFIAALGIFTLSSLWCGFSHNLFELVLSRLLQGLGGSLMMPVGRLILLRIFERHEVITTMNRVIMIAALGLMLGPVLGGFITHYFTWRWIFWVNVPMGIFTMVMAWQWIEDVKPQIVPPLDILGFILFGTSLAAFTFGLSAFSETAVRDIYSVIIMITAVLLMILYFFRSRKQPHPIVNPALFQARTFRISVVGNLISRLGFGGIPFLLPLLLQVALGYSPQLSGLLLAPTAIGVLLIKFYTLRLLRLLGYKRLLILNTLFVALSMLSFTLVNTHTSVYFIACLTFMYGFLMSLQYSAMNSLAYSDISQNNLSSATSIMSTLQQLAQSFGVAIGALLVRIFSTGTTEKFQLTTGVFHSTFISLGIITLFSTFIFMRLNIHDGHQMIKTENAAT